MSNAEQAFWLKAISKELLSFSKGFFLILSLSLSLYPLFKANQKENDSEVLSKFIEQAFKKNRNP